jgi:ribosomal protein L31
MSKSTIKAAATATAIAALAAVPAQAHKPAEHPSQSHKCTPHKVGFTAAGTLESAALTQTAGADTTTRKDDRYSGTLTVDVKRASHKAATGSQTYTLDNDRVKLYDANHDGTKDEPKAGDRVKVKGKYTRLSKKCDQSGFTSTTDVRRAEFRPAKVKKTSK